MTVDELKKRQQETPRQQSQSLQIVLPMTMVQYDPIFNKRVFRVTPGDAHLGAVCE